MSRPKARTYEEGVADAHKRTLVLVAMFTDAYPNRPGRIITEGFGITEEEVKATEDALAVYGAKVLAARRSHKKKEEKRVGHTV